MVNSRATTKKITQKYIEKQAKRKLKWNTRKYLCNTKVSNEGTEEQKWHKTFRNQTAKKADTNSTLWVMT